jgi:hypothetical protein
MSLTAEEIARRETELMENPNEVPVRVRVHRYQGLCIPHPEGEEEEKAVFSIMTFGDHLLIEQACRHEVEREDGKTQFEVDFNEVRRLTLKRNLLSWSLDVPIERKRGWMTPESYERVGKVSAPLVEAFLEGFWDKSIIDEKEENVIGRQAAVLFGKNSRGVSDACEAIRLYCTMGSQWEKFGIKEDELNDMPYRKYLMLRLMTSHESEAMRRQAQPRNQSQTKIAGRGGRTRPSRGQRIPL